MGKFILEDADRLDVDVNGKKIKCIKKEMFQKFNSDVLGLGKINKKSNRTESLCAIFDLQGFTDFTKQIDPRLVVPDYLSDFLEWFFKSIAKEMVANEYELGYHVYCDPPFFSKYMGDGVLFLWDVSAMGNIRKRNIVFSCYEVCKQYQSQYYQQIRNSYSYAPKKLRCGIALGDVYSVGDEDYFGACINLAARLQKFGTLSFAASKRGMDFEHNDDKSPYKDIFIIKEAIIRGIGEHELVYILKDEDKTLTKQDKLIIKNP
jgi:hypothetical protein